MANEMRDRLVELLQEAHYKWTYSMDNFENVCADHLIENGVIVLPCKVGDTVVVNSETYKCIGFSIAPPTNTVNLVNEKNKLYQPSIEKIAKLKELSENG